MYESKIRAILRDQSASYWLKESLERSLVRDPLDALNDAEILAEILKERFVALTGAIS